MSRLKTWASIVQQVQNSGQQSLRQKTQQEQLRRNIYKDLLTKQIQSHQNTINHQKQTNKTNQQSLLHKHIKTQNQQISSQQYNRSKINQQCLHQNLQMIVNRNYSMQKLKKQQRQQAQRNPQHPFVKKLVYKQDQRKQQFSRNQSAIYKVNYKIGQQKQTLKMKQKQIEKDIETKYKKYIEETEAKRQKDRQKYLNKYINKTEDLQEMKRNYSHMTIPADTLDKQCKQYPMNTHKYNRNNKKYQIDELDIKTQQINQHLLQESMPSKSPAFLGKITQNDDRKRQLKYINRNLGIDSNMNNSKSSTNIMNTRDNKQHLLPITHSNINNNNNYNPINDGNSNNNSHNNNRSINNYYKLQHKTLQHPSGTTINHNKYRKYNNIDRRKYHQRYNILTHRRQQDK